MSVADISVSIIIPAFNEEANIADALASIAKAVDGLTDDYEILVFNDGSKDRTGTIVREKCENNDKIKLIVFEKNMGYGHIVKEGIRLASKKYLSIFHGDNDMAWESTRDLIIHSQEADIITAYMKDTKKRPLSRRVISRLFVLMMNSFFGMRLRYFNGPFICPCALLRSIPLKSSGLTVVAEAKIRLIKKKYRYQEISFEHTGRVGGKSTAISGKSLMAVISAVIILWKDVYFSKGPKAEYV